MRFSIVATLALVAVTRLGAQTFPDLTTATSAAGNWSYASVSDGSEATFTNAGAVQLSIHCTRSTRRLAIGKAVSGTAPTLGVWTSGGTRSVAASFDPASRRLTADFATYDSLLDNLAKSRGRIGFMAGPEPPLVVPAWPEVARVIEDCRA